VSDDAQPADPEPPASEEDVVRGPTLLPEWVTAVLDGDEAPTFTRMRLVPGEFVPGTRYRILKWLGDGGMGVVYEAEQVDVDRRVAVKILRPEVCEKPEVVERFRNEARTANRVGSEHIADVYDFAVLPDNRLLFAMELLEGSTLAAELRNGPMDPGRAIGLLRQLCKGLGDAHAAGIVHRDIKPDNIILVEDRGRPDYVKIMDLGIATWLEEGRAVASQIAGTPHYVAPEIVTAQSFDHRVDVYSVGCTAYEMLTGRPPFEGKSIPAVLVAHIEQEPVPPSEFREGDPVPAALEQVILKCLGKHPDDRFEDMVDLEAALCEAQVTEGLHTGWDDLPLPDVDEERRERLLREMPDPRLPERRGQSRWFWPTASVLAVALMLGAGWYWSPSRQLTEYEQERIEEISDDSRAAAAKFLFVYPPADDPNGATAYAYVQQMEAVEGPEAKFARKRAADLRREFADTLIRLGDNYWAQDGGQTFAEDYYAQALVFDPKNEHAGSRVAMTRGSIDALREKVDKQAFTQADLVKAEPLVVLAEEDPVERQQKLVELEKKEEERAQHRKEKLARLASSGSEERPKTKPLPKPEAAPPAPPPVQPPPTAGDPVAADQLVKSAKQAMRVGQGAQAENLFKQAIEQEPKHAKALIGLSDLNFARGDFKQAASFAERAVRVRPKRAEYHVRLGRAYDELGRADEAAEAFARADELSASD
jgi:tRNA A-37 threonylcarbamoyl transferase component Bud32/TolA-binding protein